MKIQCNACEGAEANVLCCADEAALCWVCDEKVHAANKLARKHHRVPLSNSSSQMPKCDICQESVGYFFCLEDRALLCRKCDYAIHTANPSVSAHQRFLLTGVKVALEVSYPVSSCSKEKLKFSEGCAGGQGRAVSDTLSKEKLKSSERGAEAKWRTVSDTLPKEKPDSAERSAEAQWRTMSNRSTSISTFMENNEVLLSQGDGLGRLPATKLPFTGGTMMPEVMPEWPIDEFLELSGLNENFGFPEQESSKADNGNLGDSDLSPVYDCTTEGEFDIDDCLGQVPEITWTVPEIPSPPTASGLHWPRTLRKKPVEHSVFVPDVCSPFQSLYRDQMGLPVSKRRRHC
ncbi:B-box zinc finger protein 22 [Aristolochia californica]|uniref:B-box zinc finger protein 22 n=1 Tax=Aristolochia californica TaxID=171875 RepID=UPI0035D8F71E